MQKCTLQVSPASRPMKTKEVRLSVLACIGAQACTATIAGIVVMIRTSKIVNIGSPIGCCGDSRDNSPTASDTAYATSRMTVAAAEKTPRRRAVAVNFTHSLPLAAGWSRQPIGYSSPQNDKVKDHRQQFRGSKETHHEEEREDGSSHSQHPPPAKRNPPPHHCQCREDKHQCCAPSEPDSGDRVFARGRDSTQKPAVAD